MPRPALQIDNSAPEPSAHSLITLRTMGPTQFIDITDRIAALVDVTGVSLGIVNVQALHTTTAILVNENEPLLLTDFEAMLSRTVPTERRYLHDDPSLRAVNLTPNERRNGHSHCRALLLGASACLNIVEGRLMLGRWQRLFFVELDGPSERLISAVVLGQAGTRR